MGYFNPLPSHEGRLLSWQGITDLIAISIHSPLTRGDGVFHIKFFVLCTISIHSPLTRGDYGTGGPLSGPGYFNPLPSHEGRRLCDVLDGIDGQFQSTPLSRGETLKATITRNIFQKFQSTPLSRGETPQRSRNCTTVSYFNPLPSHEGRRNVLCLLMTMCHFNPLPSHEGRHIDDRSDNTFRLISIHSPLTRGDFKYYC